MKGLPFGFGLGLTCDYVTVEFRRTINGAEEEVIKGFRSILRIRCGPYGHVKVVCIPIWAVYRLGLLSNLPARK